MGSTQILEQNNCLKHLGVTSGHGARADGWSLGWRGLEGLDPSLLSWGIQPLLDEPFSLAAPKEWAQSHRGRCESLSEEKGGCSGLSHPGLMAPCPGSAPQPAMAHAVTRSVSDIMSRFPFITAPAACCGPP